MARVGVLGAGTWGTALARMLALNGHETAMWSPRPRDIDALAKTHYHKHLEGVKIPETILLTKDAREACAEKDLIVFALPSVAIRQTAQTVKPYLRDGQILVSVAKGMEADTLLTMTGIINDVLEEGRQERFHYAALSGPTHAEEVARDLPSAIVAACREDRVARTVQDVFMNSSMRVYRSSDLLGVELCGALKNVIAIAAGACVGMGFGDNTRAALVTRGMAEIKRLGLKMGCRPETFDGLAGIGDMIVTSTSLHSRNMRAGMLIGQGMEPKKAVESIGMVVEGINALPAALELADRYQVELPITFAVDAVVNGGQDPRRVVLDLMMRDKKAEF